MQAASKSREPTMSQSPSAQVILAEMREFAAFSPCEQRYIRRSLDVGLGRGDAFRTWSRSGEETASIRAQYVVYQDLKVLRGLVCESEGFDGIETIMGPLMRVTTFDLAQERIDSFGAYRFLYERLLGASVRPWLPSAFCGRLRCRRSARTSVATCCSRSAKRPRRRRAGHVASRCSSLNSLNSKRPDETVSQLR
jgi:hypothetical protein